MTPEERREFLKTHRLAILGVERSDAPPHLSPVYYVMDGDDLLVSTTRTRVKAKLVLGAGLASLCVIAEQPPFPYLTVAGRARIENEGAVELMMRVGEAMSGRPVPDSMNSLRYIALHHNRHEATTKGCAYASVWIDRARCGNDSAASTSAGERGEEGEVASAVEGSA